MKILWVKHGKLLPVDAGGKIRSYNILKYLASRHDVTLISPYSGQPDTAYEHELRKHFVNAIPVCTNVPEDSDSILAQAWHYFARLGLPAPYAVSKFTSSKVRAILKEKFRGQQFDVAVCDFLAVSRNFPSQLTIPTVLFQHNVETFLWRRQAQCEHQWLKKLLFTMEAVKTKRYETATIMKFQNVIAVSETDRRLMASAASVAITVVPTGVDLQQFRATSPVKPRGHEVIFTGSMDWEANVDAMQYFCNKIWPRVLSAVPDAKFLIVGRNPHSSVKKLACDSVEVTGTVPSVIEYLKSAAVVVVPLRIGGGTRLKIFESMAMGKAIVSTAIGAEGLEIHDQQDIVLADDPPVFADWVVRLLRDEGLRERIGIAASQTASQYDWSVIAPRFESVLARVAGLRQARQAPSRVEADVAK